MPLVVGLALGVRVWFLFRLYDWPLVSEPPLDGADYLGWARGLMGGAIGPLHHAPGYPTLLAIALVLFDHSLTGVLLLQVVGGAASCGFLTSIGRQYLGSRPGAVGGCLFALYGPAVGLDVQVLAECLLLFLLVLAVWLLGRPQGALVQGAGVVLAAAVLVRPTAAAAGLAIILYLYAMRQHERGRWLSFTLAWLVALAPAVVAIRTVTGAWQIQEHGGFNLYIGNSPRGSGTATFRMDGSFEFLESEARRNGVRTSWAQEGYYVRKLLGEIRSDPFGWIRIMGRKLLLSVRDHEVRDTHSYQWFLQVAPELHLLPSFAVIASLAAVGMTACLRQKVLWSLPAVVMLSMWATLVALVVGWRYRAPIVPFLCLYAGHGALQLATDLRTSGATFLRLAGVGAAVFLVACPGGGERVGDTAEEWAWVGRRMAQLGRNQESLSHLQRALADDPSNGIAWAVLASLRYGQGDLAAAEDSARSALRANSHNPVAHGILASIAIDRRNPRLGVAHLTAAGATRPAEAIAGLRRALLGIPVREQVSVLRELQEADEASGHDQSGTTVTAIIDRAVQERRSSNTHIRPNALEE